MDHRLDADVDEVVGQEVIGYSPAGGYLVRGRRQANGQVLRLGPDDWMEVVMADAVDQKVFGVGADEPVVTVVPGLGCDSTVRRYLARASWFVAGRGGPQPEGSRA